MFSCYSKLFANIFGLNEFLRRSQFPNLFFEINFQNVPGFNLDSLNIMLGFGFHWNYTVVPEFSSHAIITVS